MVKRFNLRSLKHFQQRKQKLLWLFHPSLSLSRIFYCYRVRNAISFCVNRAHYCWSIPPWPTFNWNVKIPLPRKMNLCNDYLFFLPRATDRANRLVLRLIDVITELPSVANIVSILLLTFIAWLSWWLYRRLKLFNVRGISYIRWHRLISYRLSIVTEFFVPKQPFKMSNVTWSICSRYFK